MTDAETNRSRHRSTLGVSVQRRPRTVYDNKKECIILLPYTSKGLIVFTNFASTCEYTFQLNDICKLLQGDTLVVEPVGGYQNRYSPFTRKMIKQMKRSGLSVHFEPKRRGYTYGDKTFIEARGQNQVLGFIEAVCPDSFQKFLHYKNDITDLKRGIIAASENKPTVCVVAREGVVFGNDYYEIYSNLSHTILKPPSFSCKECRVDASAMELAVAWLLYENRNAFGFVSYFYRDGGNHDNNQYFTLKYPIVPQHPLPDL